MPGQIFFLIVAAISVISALGVIFNRNVVHSALFLLMNFGTLAVFYFMLNAQFLGVAQILVYAGAIVVLFPVCSDAPWLGFRGRGRYVVERS